MKLSKKLFLIILSVFVLINVYFYSVSFLKLSENNLEKVSSEVSISTKVLLSSFINNEKKSNELYAGKILEVVGFVSEISLLNNRHTILLYIENEKSGIICDVHNSQIEKIKKLKKHQKIKIKGLCKGFLKDVVLLNCYIDLELNE